MLAYIYELSETLNDKVNIEKLDLEIRASEIENYETPPYLFKGKVYIDFSIEPSVDHKNALDGIISSHDGEEAPTSEKLVTQREQKIRELTLMAIYHPLLNEVDTVEYLTSIDNWFNGWKRSGVTSAIVTKIATDAADTSHPQHGFLTTVVDSVPDGQGGEIDVLTYQFLLSIITS